MFDLILGCMKIISAAKILYRIFLFVGATCPFIVIAQESLLVPCQLEFNSVSKVQFAGSLGQELDKILDARICSDFARNTIAPEATNAFVKKEDDKFLLRGEKRGLWQGEFWGKWILSAHCGISLYRL